MTMDDVSALGWIGYRVDDVYGARLGKVEDVYVDERTGAPVWLLVKLGRFGDEHVPVPVSEAATAGGRVWIPYERQTIKSAPALTPGAPLTRERELALAAHYHVQTGRAHEIQELPHGSVTAVPALAGEGERQLGTPT